VEACLRELLRVLGVLVAVRPYNLLRPLNVTFYTNMNFVVSRRRIRYYTHTAWRALATRFIDEGVCLPQTVATAAPNGGAVAGAPARGALPAASYASGYGGDVPDVEDAARHAKYTLGMATEIISQTIFNFNPLEEGPAPQVPSDHECERQASTSCADSNPHQPVNVTALLPDLPQISLRSPSACSDFLKVRCLSCARRRPLRRASRTSSGRKMRA
jgi:hypothetical protein